MEGQEGLPKEEKFLWGLETHREDLKIPEREFQTETTAWI